MKNILFSLLLISSTSFAGEIRIEGSLINFTRNEIAIPGDGGNLFNTAQDQWKQKNGFAYRIYYHHKIDEKSQIRFLYAPLSTSFEGEFKSSTNFNGQNFNQGPATVNYKFNSYRLGYIRQIHKSDSVVMNVGFVGKIRDAKIEVVQGAVSSSRKDLGFVPLLHFDVNYNFYQDLSLLFDLDGLAAPQGRAFDGGLFLQRDFQNKYKVFAGYRFLEGGADNEKVKTFSFVHYYSAGIAINF